MNVIRDYLLFDNDEFDFLFKKKEMEKFFDMWIAGEDIVEIASKLKRKQIEVALLIMSLDYQGLIPNRTRGIFGGKVKGNFVVDQGEQSMKNGKKPTMAQSRFMESHGVNCRTWLVAKDTPTEMIVVSRNAKGKPKKNQIKTLAK